MPKPLRQSARQESKSRENFSLWLRKVPFEFLQDVYRHNRIRRDIPVRPFIVDATSPNKKDHQEAITTTEISHPTQPVILRRSVFFLIFSLLGIEIFFDLIYIGLRIILMYADLPHFFPPLTIESLYVGSLMLTNLFKIIFMIVTALEWIHFTYEITGKEIISRYGILNHKEKIFLCTYVQEVMYIQSIMGKIFNYGTIELHNPTLEEVIYLDSIPNPKKHADIIKATLPLAEKKEYMPIKMGATS